MRIVDAALLRSYRFHARCTWCKRFREVVAHHLFGRGMGGGKRIDHPVFLAALCAECHQLHHDGQRPLTCDLLAVQAAAYRTTQDAIRAAARDILALPRWASRAEAEALLLAHGIRT